jgi:hypothetical protein
MGRRPAGAKPGRYLSTPTTPELAVLEVLAHADGNQDLPRKYRSN